MGWFSKLFDDSRDTRQGVVFTDGQVISPLEYGRLTLHLADQDLRQSYNNLISVPIAGKPSIIAFMKATPGPAYVALRVLHTNAYLTCLSTIFRAPPHAVKEAVSGVLEGLTDAARRNHEPDNDGYVHGLHRMICESAAAIQNDFANPLDARIFDLTGGRAVDILLKSLREAYFDDLETGTEIDALEAMHVVALARPIVPGIHQVMAGKESGRW
jgi:hypothetical protein